MNLLETGGIEAEPAPAGTQRGGRRLETRSMGNPAEPSAEQGKSAEGEEWCRRFVLIVLSSYDEPVTNAADPIIPSSGWPNWEPSSGIMAPWRFASYQ